MYHSNMHTDLMTFDSSLLSLDVGVVYLCESFIFLLQFLGCNIHQQRQSQWWGKLLSNWGTNTPPLFQPNFFNHDYMHRSKELSWPFKPYSALWLHHTLHCTEKTISACLHVGSASTERVGQEEVGRVTCRVTSTWWLLGLAVKVARNRFRN